MLRIIAVLILSLLFFNNVIAQEISISGYVKDVNGNAVNRASITLRITTDNILDYTTSNAEGYFLLKKPSQDSVLHIFVNALKFEPKDTTVNIQKQIFPIQIILEPRETELPEVVVKTHTSGIRQDKDTLNYNVDYFKNEQDRILRDVLTKLPGISIEQNGTILYQNKAINRFYIEDDDIISNRYNIASNNLPVDAVENIQIIENHQPVEMLDGMISSERAAINIKLKPSAAKIIGRQIAMLGGSSQNLLSNNQLSLFKLGGSTKIISTLKHNNIGIDFNKEIIAVGKMAAIDNLLNSNLVTVSNIQPPSINSERYNRNNDFLQTNSISIPLRKDYRLKLFTGFLTENNRMKNKIKTTYYFPQDTLNLEENLNNKYLKQIYYLSSTIDKNSKNIYLKNILNFKYIHEQQTASVTGTNLITQKAKTPLLNFGNELSILKKINNHILNISSSSIYKNQNQALFIRPGLYNEIINENKPYKELQQFAQQSVFSSENKVGSTFTLNKTWILSSKLGFLLESKNINTHLQTDSHTIAAAYPFINNLQSFRSKVFLENELRIERKKITASLSSTLHWQALALDTTNSIKHYTIKKLFFDNTLNARWKISGKFSINASIGNQNSAGGIEEMKNGFFLYDYKQLSRAYNTPVGLYQMYSYTIGNEYKNVLKMLFINAAYSKNYTVSNIIYNTLPNNGFLIVNATELQNTQQNETAALNISQYFGELKMSVKTRFSYQRNKYPAILNNDYTNIQNRIFSSENTFVKDIKNTLHILYSIKLSSSHYKQQSDTKRYDAVSFFNIRQNLSVSKTIANTQFGCTFEHIYNNRPAKNNNIFTDLYFKIILKKLKADLSLDAQNIFNNQIYRFNYFETNATTSSAFSLRPFSILAGIKFNL